MYSCVHTGVVAARLGRLAERTHLLWMRMRSNLHESEAALSQNGYGCASVVLSSLSPVACSHLYTCLSLVFAISFHVNVTVSGHVNLIVPRHARSSRSPALRLSRRPPTDQQL